MRVFLDDNDQLRFPAVEDLPEKLVEAVITFEDKRFYYHPGVDPIAVLRAIITDIKAGKIVSGASTIPMQLVRLSENRDRTFLNKMIEMLKALRIDAYYSKRQILSLYLNNAPYGGNIIGYQGACHKYFGKSGKELTWAEAATLAVLPNSPDVTTPFRNREVLIRKRNRLLERLHEKGLFDRMTLKHSLSESLPEEPAELPFVAPHLASYLKKTMNTETIHTTIDINKQELFERLTYNFNQRLKYNGINNLSLLIIDNRKREVVTYIGSADYFDRKNSGMVDGVRAERSTGSILKPFLYALAIDKGQITRESLIPDIPSYFGAYSPQNYDHEYTGLVRADQALIRSLNIPAVRLLSDYGLRSFYSFLQKTDMRTLRYGPDHYGLTLITGGCEGTLFDITTMFSMLACNGMHIVPDIVKKEKTDSGRELISAESSYIISDILSDLRRPGMEYYYRDFVKSRNIAWKTGTSYGHKDAWAVGYTPEYTVGVWTGNFSGESNRGLTGTYAAGPLLFEIFNVLQDELTWFSDKDLNFKKVKVCKDSGYRVSEHCSDWHEVLMPSEADVVPVCPWHRSVWVSEDGSESVCSRCWDEERKKVNLFLLPGIIRKYYNPSGVKTIMPPHRKSCPSSGDKGMLRITYPEPGANIIIPATGEDRARILKIDLSSSGNRKFTWYVNGAFHKETDTSYLWFDGGPGKYDIVVYDQEGNWDSVSFSIEYP